MKLGVTPNRDGWSAVTRMRSDHLFEPLNV